MFGELLKIVPGTVKWNWVPQSGLKCSVLGLLKIVPGLCELVQKCPYVVCMKLFEMSGLSWLIKKINRLMLDVLT